VQPGRGAAVDQDGAMTRRRRTPQDYTAIDLYSRVDRKADRKRGKKDGRRRLPTYTGVVGLVEDGAPVTTEYHKYLLEMGRYDIDDAYQSFVDRSNAHRRRLAALNATLAEDDERVAYGRKDLDRAQEVLTPEELEPRNPREVALAGSAALLSRRVAMRRQRIDAAMEELARRQAVKDGRVKQIDEIYGLIDGEFAKAQALGWRRYRCCLMRVATYWDGVVQTHPEGGSLVSILPPVSLDPPGWLKATFRGGELVVTAAAAPPPAAESEPDAEPVPRPDADSGRVGDTT
jgi:hypothetical protein